MRSIRSLVVGVALAAIAACSSPSSSPADAAIDAPVDAAAAPDAPPAPPSRAELVGGGRLRGGTITADVQLGHPIAQVPATGGTITLTPGAPVAR